MNRVLILFIISLFMSCSSSTKVALEPEKEIYHGKIRVITQHEYDFDKPSGESKFLIQHSIMQFARKGYKTNEVRYDRDTNVSSIWIYSYDKHHRLMEEKWLSSDSSIAYRTVYTYNQKDELVAEENFGTGNIFEGRNVFSYTTGGQLREKMSYNKDNKLLEKSVYYYQPKRIDEALYDADGSFQSLISYSYDEDSKSMTISGCDDEGETTEKSDYHYEEQGYIKNLLYESVEDSLKEQHQYKYEYDKKGNWTMRLELKNDLPSKIILREYGYY